VSNPRPVKIKQRVTEIEIEGTEYEVTEIPNQEPQLRKKMSGRYYKVEESADPEYVFPMMDYFHAENARRRR
jgi:hypothetical protein